MIKLCLPPTPKFLTPQFIEEKTNKYKEDASCHVWNIPELKKAVYEASYGKCVYSEIKLNEEGKYMHIDHFYPKSLYPEKVILWGNLMASSSICNIKKKDTDPDRIDIVNPFEDDPKNHFYIQEGRLFAKDKKGRNTIEVCDLNNSSHLRNVRLKIERKLKDTLELIFENYKLCSPKAVENLKTIMEECSRENSFSATKSTFVLKNMNYIYMKNDMTEKGIWSEAFQSLEKELMFCCLPLHNNE